jgi:hypothetical protein
MRAYKLLRERKNGTIGPLFINARQVIKIGEWMKAEAHRTKGFAFRPGWHATSKPEAPHLSMEGRAWYEVSILKYKKLQRPKAQGGLWYLADRMKVIRRLEE